MNRSSGPVLAASGRLYSTPDNRPVRGRSWRFWYLQRSKRVWFRLPDTATDATTGAQAWLCRYDGRAILHRSQQAAWRRRWPTELRPVLWGKWPELGRAAGPEGTNLYLSIWSRWSWLHPEACGEPRRFSVELRGG